MGTEGDDPSTWFGLVNDIWENGSAIADCIVRDRDRERERSNRGNEEDTYDKTGGDRESV